MNKKIIISSDRTCDLSEELLTRFNIRTCPYHIILKDKEYLDNVDIFPKQIFEQYYKDATLPKTSCVNASEYIDYFKSLIEDNCEIIHFNLSSALSLSHQNCVIAAKEFDNVYPIDSKNLSTGTGLLVIAAAKMAQEGKTAEQIVDAIEKLKSKVNTSFILDTLEFMKAGGRCSAVAAFSANMLKIKPCINVDTADGEMKVGKKYRGDLQRVLVQYAKDRLSGKNIRNDFIFITHSGIEPEYVQAVKNVILEETDIKEIHITTANCTISCHCGPNCLGVLFIEE